MTIDTQRALKKILTLHGDLDKPIPLGATFATLLPKEEYDTVEELSGLPYPPLDATNPWCEFDPVTHTLKALVWGRATFSEEGIRITPAWNISIDNMLVTVEVHQTDFKDIPISMDYIIDQVPKELREVSAGWDLIPLSEALKESAGSNQGHTVIVSQGIFPDQGHDAHLALTFSIGESAGTLREDGSMDFRERSALHSVTEGEILGVLHPPIPGPDGEDVFGQLIPSQELHQLKINTGQGVDASTAEDDMITYTATQDGVTRFRDNTLEVVELLEIPGDVDFSTGNIHTEHGSVHIKGDVKCGFTVESPNDIIIDGVVEEADIVAGGIVIAGGVIMNGNNKVVAKGDVSAHFFRNAIIEAGGNVNADQELSHCQVTAKGKITVLGAMGIIYGGHIISGDDIHATVIGNKAHIRTCVEIRTRNATEEKFITMRELVEKEIVQLDEAIGVDYDLTSIMSAPEEDRRILAELIKIRSRMQAKIHRIDESEELQAANTNDQAPSKRIKADQKVFRGTEVIINDKALKPKADMDAPTYFIDFESQQIAFT